MSENNEVKTSLDVTVFEVLKNDNVQGRYMDQESAFAFFNRWPKKLQNQMKVVRVRSLFTISKTDLTPDNTDR